MKRLLPLALLLAFLLGACRPAAAPAETRTLTVFAAASLSDAFGEIGQAFEAAHPGVTVKFNFGGSQALRTQIEEGAPADVFASANAQEMDRLAAAGLAVDTPQTFLSNKLVVILPADNPAALEKLEDLARPGVKLVLAAGEVPVGQYARQALDLMNDGFGAEFKEQVLANVVSNEDNVRQVVAKVQFGGSRRRRRLHLGCRGRIRSEDHRDPRRTEHCREVSHHGAGPFRQRGPGGAVHRLRPFRAGTGHPREMGIWPRSIIPLQ